MNETTKQRIKKTIKTIFCDIMGITGLFLVFVVLDYFINKNQTVAMIIIGIIIAIFFIFRYIKNIWDDTE